MSICFGLDEMISSVCVCELQMGQVVLKVPWPVPKLHRQVISSQKNSLGFSILHLYHQGPGFQE